MLHLVSLAKTSVWELVWESELFPCLELELANGLESEPANTRYALVRRHVLFWKISFSWQVPPCPFLRKAIPCLESGPAIPCLESGQAIPCLESEQAIPCPQ